MTIETNDEWDNAIIIYHRTYVEAISRTFQDLRNSDDIMGATIV